MNSRLELHTVLTTLLGQANVYFQPPPTVVMKYPCIVYALSNIETKYADDIIYKARKAYTATVIDQNPDSDIPERFTALNYCRFDRFFTADNLNHYVFAIYY